MRPARRDSAPTASAAPSVTASAAVPVLPTPGLYPTPPAQLTAWTAPATTLPPKLVSAVELLVQLGFADPRQCEYREIELQTGSVWEGKGPLVRTRGWLLPASDGGPRHAVAFNGLVYEVLGVGEAADLAADVKALLAAHAQERQQWAHEHPGQVFSRLGTTATPEDATVSHQELTLAKVALLLRLGETALAEAVWQEWLEGQGALLEGSADRDPFVVLASDWLWSRFDRAVTAHMRGDDSLALESARDLPRLGAEVEAEADRRTLPRPEGVGPEGGPLPRIGFLAQADALLADQQRRHDRGPRNVELAKLGRLAGPERVAALIDALDEVSARQHGQPGGVELGSDPVVQALVGEGNAAVEPLLRVLEHDVRLTRAVHFWRDFARQRTVLGVHEAAYVALAGILQSSFFAAASTGDDLTVRGAAGRREVAQQIRAFWDKWQGVSLEERWYQVLADDDAGPEGWLDAARQITQPSNVTVLPTSTALQTSVTSGEPGPTAALRGEALRSKSAPSVAMLLAQRTGALAGDVPKGCELAQRFAAWDAAAALPSLRTLTAKAIEASQQTPGRVRHGRCIAALVLARAQAKDPDALSDYARWIVTTTGDPAESWAAKEFFEPMWRHGSDRRMAAASRTVFSAGSGWLPLVPVAPAAGGAGYERAELLDTPLLRTAGFREHVVRALGDPTPAGACKVRPDGNVEIEMLGGWSTTAAPSKVDPLLPPPGTSVLTRLADYYAWRISAQPGAPAFHPCWTAAQREAALDKVRAFVLAQR